MIYMYIYMYICIHIYIYTYIHIYVCVCVRVCVRVGVYRVAHGIASPHAVRHVPQGHERLDASFVPGFGEWGFRLRVLHCRTNTAHIRQSRPDPGRGFQAKALALFQHVVPVEKHGWSRVGSTKPPLRNVPQGHDLLDSSFMPAFSEWDLSSSNPCRCHQHKYHRLSPRTLSSRLNSRSEELLVLGMPS